MPLGIPTLGSKDQRLFSEWKDSIGFQKDQALKSLLDNFSGAIGTAINSFRGAPLPMPTIELQARVFAVEALKEYDPSRTSNMATYITGQVIPVDGGLL